MMLKGAVLFLDRGIRRNADAQNHDMTFALEGFGLFELYPYQVRDS